MNTIWNVEWMLGLPDHWFEWVLAVNIEEAAVNETEYLYLTEVGQ